MALLHDVNVTAQDTGSIDAFGRWRVSEPATLFDSNLIGGDNTFWWDEETNGTGASTASGSQASLAVSADGDFVVRQTFQRFKYQAGKSQLVLCTFNMNGNETGVTKRVGYFNSSTASPFTANIDGIYLESNGTNVGIVQGKDGSATRVAQTSWNVDPFDGTGPSGVTIDWTKANILLIDLEWLGVGRVRVGFVVDGKIYYAHAFNNANGVSSVYCLTANHSVRYEIRASGEVSGTLDQICASVQSEGGQEPVGLQVSASGPPSGISLTSGDAVLLVGVRINSASFQGTTAQILGASTMVSSNAYYRWLLCANPTYNGDSSGYPNWTTLGRGLQQSEGGSQYDVTDFGTILDQGWGATTNRVSSNPTNDGWRPGTSISGVDDEVWLALDVRSNGTYYGSLNAREL